MSTPMPKLSADLAGPRHPQRCRACGTDADGGDDLQRWREHGERDEPTPVLVILCKSCADALVEKHARLYSLVDNWAPWPGAMPLCADCRYREGLLCQHPDLKVNGGPGLELQFPQPTTAHVLASPRSNSGWKTLWRGPVRSCAGREAK